MSNPTVELKVPSVGESVTEVEVSDWLKKEGDTVRRTKTGRAGNRQGDVGGAVACHWPTHQIVKKKGERVQIGDLLGEFEASDVAAPVPAKIPSAEPPVKKPSEALAPPVDSKSPPTGKVSDASAPGLTDAATAKGSRRRGPTEVKNSASTPALNPAAEPATETASTSPTAADPTPSAPAPEPSAPPTSTPASIPEPAVPAMAAAGPDRAEEIVPMNLLRRKIAERLVAAQHTGALLTTFNEIDMTAVMALRKENQERFHERYQIKLGFMSFFIKATIEGLKKFRNSTLRFVGPTSSTAITRTSASPSAVAEDWWFPCCAMPDG